MDKFLIFTIVGLSLAAIYADRRERPGPDLHDDRGLQLRPRRHRHARRVHVLAAAVRLGLAGRSRRSWCCSSSSRPCSASCSNGSSSQARHQRGHEARRVDQLAHRHDRPGQLDLGAERARPMKPFFGRKRSTSASPRSPTTRRSRSGTAVVVALGLRSCCPHPHRRLHAGRRRRPALAVLNGAAPGPDRHVELGHRLLARRWAGS